MQLRLTNSRGPRRRRTRMRLPHTTPKPARSPCGTGYPASWCFGNTRQRIIFGFFASLEQWAKRRADLEALREIRAYRPRLLGYSLAAARDWLNRFGSVSQTSAPATFDVAAAWYRAAADGGKVDDLSFGDGADPPLHDRWRGREVADPLAVKKSWATPSSARKRPSAVASTSGKIRTSA